MKQALLVIDMQAYFMQTAPKDLPSRIVNRIHSSRYDFVGFSIFRNVEGSNLEKSLDWHRCKSDEEVVLAPEFKELASSDNMFEKHTYSVFKNGKLLDVLKANNIEEISFCGVDTDACILASAFDAFDHDFKVKILFDLCYSGGGLDEAVMSIALRNLQAAQPSR